LHSRSLLATHHPNDRASDHRVIAPGSCSVHCRCHLARKDNNALHTRLATECQETGRYPHQRFTANEIGGLHRFEPFLLVSSAARTTTSAQNENNLNDWQRRILRTTRRIGIPPHLSIQRMSLLFGKAFGALADFLQHRFKLL
jgi:hypothetical protein